MSLVGLLTLISGSQLLAADFYVSPSAGGSGTGSFSNPWKLAAALAGPGAVRPGDTIWLRGGTYGGSFTSDLTGSLASPIVVRSYPGEWARIDGAGLLGGGAGILNINGAYAVYRDFEVFSSTNPNPDGGQGTRPDGIAAAGPNIKLVNLVVHDTGQGISFSESSTDSEVSGCLIYYNGNSQQDHGIYAQNLNGSKWLLGNIFFRNYGFGIHAYATNAHLNNINLVGNVSFANGKLNPAMPYKSNILLGAGGAAATSCTSSPQVAQNPSLLNNYTYNPRGTGGRQLDLGYLTGSCNPTAIGNYLVGDTTLTLGPAFGSIAMTGNTFYGPVSGFSSLTYPINTYLSSRPSGIRVFLQPNPYEAGRAQIVVYNWDLSPTVSLDLSSVLSIGSQYEIRNAQDFFAPPVRSGIYPGGTISLPMTGLTVAIPVGRPPPLPTSPEFAVFIVIQTAPPPPSPMSFYTVTPCRVVDTRLPIGPLGGPALAAGTDRTFVVANQCGIPVSAKAVSMNVAVTQPTAGPGFLTVYPGGRPLPVSSTVNYGVGRTRANNTVAGLGGAGDVKVHCEQGSGSVQVIIDVNGYFQ